ncbi:unnamed protein product, partial [Oncorhynchus mykiss]
TQNRMKLMADNYEDDHLKTAPDQTNHKPSPDQMIPPLLSLSENRNKLKLYIAHLTDLCHDRDPSILSVLTPPPHLSPRQPTSLGGGATQDDFGAVGTGVGVESGELQEYANSVLQQIADYCPDILEQVVNALEESC